MDLSKFTNKYKITKTLRFELKPIGKTKEFIEKNGIVGEDTKRADDYKETKKLIDEYHKKFIERCFLKINEPNSEIKKEFINELNIFNEVYCKTEKDEKDKKKINEVMRSLRKMVVSLFKNYKQDEDVKNKYEQDEDNEEDEYSEDEQDEDRDEDDYSEDEQDKGKKKKKPFYKKLFDKDLFTELLPREIKNKEEEELIEVFKSFTTYFKGFQENRKNMYSDEDKSTAIAYRCINQNLPKFIDNIKNFSKVKEFINNDLRTLEKRFRIDNVEENFQIDKFINVLSQSGIDFYNNLIGGYSEENGNKVQGINEYINLFNQKNEQKLPRLKPLYKQILSDRSSVSFIPPQYENGTKLFASIDEFYKRLQEDGLIKFEKLFTKISTYDLNKIYLNSSSINTISNELLGDWDTIRNFISQEYDKVNLKGKITKKYENTKEKYIKANKTITELNSYIAETGKSIDQFLIEKCNELIKNILENHKIYSQIDNTEENLSESEISKIKLFLDSIKDLQQFIKLLSAGLEEGNKDERFYSDYDMMYNSIEPLTLLYNRTRNYLTKKPYSIEKIKINFKCPTLLNGWDENKENSNLSIIFIKDNSFYLGIMNKQFNRSFEELDKPKTKNTYKKMVYKLLPGPNKMLPKVFFSRKGIETFSPSEEIQRIYKGKIFKENKEALCSLINFYKDAINRHDDWSKFNFEFKNANEYEDINDFYRDIEIQGYKVTFVDIDSEYIDNLVNDGKLYLFQIYNKDFSESSKGVPNLHTLYWKEIFSPENLKDVVYKLNGEAEVFFRKKSITNNIITHKKDEPITNKDPIAGKETSTFAYDIIKDRRFTCDKFQFHVPITLNFKSEDIRRNDFNYEINSALKNSNDFHIIGIDRGERNLLSLVVIDSSGKIIEQISLNDITTFDANGGKHSRDYHAKLSEREKANKESRQNWGTINTIKELKEGYLSQAVHIITQLVVKYNAIVVLEDLNSGFKRGRQKFEKQVYQKFEKMLIDKLNYLVDKQKMSSEIGGTLKALQLTNKFESFRNLQGQSGILFYIPAWMTSKIDPTTGFVNLFYTKYQSVDKTKEFIEKFDSVYFDNNTYVFEFDYKNFTLKAEDSKTKWSVYSNGIRIEHYKSKNNWQTKDVDLTKEFAKLFEDYSIQSINDDMKDFLLKQQDADFYKRFMWLFSLVMQMRNSDENRDFIISPVKNGKGEFFNSSLSDEKLPLDADANGAYNIAKKGLYIVNERIKKGELSPSKGLKLAIKNCDWLKYAQGNPING